MFIDEALSNVFDVETTGSHNFSGTTESPNIQDSDYQVLLDYYKQQNILDLKVLIGSLNLLAYGHIQDKEPLVKYICKFSKQILLELDTTTPLLEENFDKRVERYYKDITNSNFSYRLLKAIDITHYQILTPGYYGLMYLLLLLSENCYSDFEEWYLQTSRIDLKVYFTYIVMHDYRLIFKNISFANSKINWLKAFYILSKYKIARFIPLGKEEFHSIISLPLTDKEKLDLIIYYLFNHYSGFDYNFKEPELLEKDLTLLQNLNLDEVLNVAYLDSLNLHSSQYHILSILINYIKDVNNKLPIYDYIIKNIEKYLEKQLTTGHEILLANVYGTVLIASNDKVFCNVENSYNSVKKELTKPYAFHRNKEKWSKNICIMLFYTIALYVAKSSDSNYRKILLDDFLSIKNNLPHYLDNEIDCYITQLYKQM